jgi:hypothetical protein
MHKTYVRVNGCRCKRYFKWGRGGKFKCAYERVNVGGRLCVHEHAPQPLHMGAVGPCRATSPRLIRMVC